MAEGVVAEFETIVEPHLKSLDALIDLARLVEFLLVDEADDGDLLIAQSAQQFRGHRGDVGGGHAVGHPGGKIVDGDRNLAVELLRGLRIREDREDAECEEGVRVASAAVSWNGPLEHDARAKTTKDTKVRKGSPMRSASQGIRTRARIDKPREIRISHLDRIVYNLTNWLIKSMPRLSAHPESFLPRMGSRGQPEESRAAILRAAAHEFAEHGIAGARTDAIAREARVNKALLYYYFKDKETLYGAVLDDAFSGLKTAVFRVLDGDLPPREKILAYAGAYFDFIASNQLYPRLMQREMMRAREGQSPHIDKIIKNYIRPIFGRVGELMQKGIADGEFRPVNPVHFVPSMVAMIVFYFSSAPMMQKIVGFNPLTPERIAERRAAVLDFISAALFRPQSTTPRKEHAHERA